MRFRSLIAAAGVCVAACSKPQPPSNQGIGQPDGTGRDLRLGSSLSSDGPVVSDLEAGRTPKPRLVAPVELSKFDQATKTARAPKALLAAMTVAPKLAVTASAPTQTETSRALAMAPMAESPSRPTLAVGGGLNSSALGDDESFPASSRRGPTIIIRGGRGGPDDDCDIRHPRSHGGIAVHSMAPTPGGGRVSTSPRGGIR